MARKIISQAEAYRTKNCLRSMEERDRIRNNRYWNQYPGGVEAERFDLDEVTFAALNMAVKLDCNLVAKLNQRQLVIYAIPRKQG